MKRILLAAIAALAWTLAPVGAQAMQIWTSTMDGLQEVGPNLSPGTGLGSLTYDQSTMLLSWTFSFSGLTAAAAAGHLHGPAAPGVNANVMISFGAIPAATSGAFAGSAVLTAAQDSALQNGLMYANIHTSTFPGGEIRGQLIPEPASAGLLALALGGLVAIRRRLAA